MKCYAIGDQRLETAVIHGSRSGLGKDGMQCTLFNLFFKQCPPMHAIEVTPEMLLENVTACNKFKLFATKEDALKHRNSLINLTDLSNLILADYPIYEVEVKNNIEGLYFEPYQFNNQRYQLENHKFAKVDSNQITPLSVSYQANGQNIDVRLPLPRNECRIM